MCLAYLAITCGLQYREKLLVGADQLREIRDEFQHQVLLLSQLAPW